MKRLLTIIIASLVLGTGVFFVMQLYVSAQTKKGALQVTSSPESKVYLNNTYLGQTPLCRCEAADMLSPGDYTVRLVPLKGGFSEYQEKVEVTQGVLTVVDRKFDKAGLSEGSTISLDPLLDKHEAQLSVLSIPEQSDIFLDDKQIGKSPLLFKNPTDADHILRIDKIGYKEKTLRVRTQKGYKLVAQVYLGVDQSISTGTSASLSAAPNVSSTPTPSASPTIAPTAQVTILETPTGYLRVHSDSSVSSAEVGRVTPGENYDLVDEQSGWYEIKLPNGKMGWISNQYAKKQ